ncbi:hypothetical protein BDW74DRAFT_183126 [Aspergillus multicolor]|uniref:uncharacterized protein n=1 Tax=Aspergillus multicolor TaxID=41759 RepID=UPI003CCDB6ED
MLPSSIENGNRHEELAGRFRSSQSQLDEMKKTIDELHRKVALADLSPDACGRIQELLEPLQTATQRVREGRVPNGLRFPSVNERYDAIANSDFESFDWLLDDEGSDLQDFSEADRDAARKARRDLIQWLRAGSGVFQLCGKIGSGKSTIMKYLLDNRKTKALLGQWAAKGDREKSLVIGSVFLWKPGTKDQNTWNGLVRSLLYSVAVRSPNLIPLLFPNEWDASTSESRIVFERTRDLDRAFEILWSSKEEIYKTRKLVIFIDALDEYVGQNNTLLAKLLSWVRNNPDIKLCVSTRDLPEIQAHLKSYPLIRVHEISCLAISRYVRETIEGNVYFQKITSSDEQESLLRHVMARPDGVFLWVTLISQELDQGLSQGDDLDVLYEKVNGLPTELNKLFKRQVDSVHQKNRKDAYVFLVMSLSCAPWPLLRLSFLGDYLKSRTFADRAMSPLPQAQVDERLDRARRNVYGYCKGLLEVKDMVAQGQPSFQTYVVFTHRSIVEFLASEDIVSKMTILDKRTTFDPLRAACQTFWPI